MLLFKTNLVEVARVDNSLKSSSSLQIIIVRLLILLQQIRRRPRRQVEVEVIIEPVHQRLLVKPRRLMRS